ncbi:hypothetical protein BgiMline_016825 [Biomphalaria glabrata]|nr:hypothetical protein BgiMline_009605 [Biomphalaria glabrata]
MDVDVDDVSLSAISQSDILIESGFPDNESCLENHQYTAMKEMCVHNLPLEFQDQNFLLFLLMARILTCKIIVLDISQHRPQSFTLDRRIGDMERVGTGSLIDVSRCGLHRQWELLQLAGLNCDRRDLFTLSILTSRHLVYDTDEALHTTVQFFHFFNHVPATEITGSDIRPFPDGDDQTCLLICKGVPPGLIEELKDIQDKLLGLENYIPNFIKARLSNQTFLVSYPHGEQQMMCHGWCQEREDNNAEAGDRPRKCLEHQVCTCPGSLGAPMITFMNLQNPSGSNYKMDIWLHLGRNLETGFKVSHVK